MDSGDTRVHARDCERQAAAFRGRASIPTALAGDSRCLRDLSRDRTSHTRYTLGY